VRRPQLELETQEGVVITMPLAGPLARFLAWALDLACLGGALTILSSLASPFSALSPEWASALLLLAFFVLKTTYNILLEFFWRGQTLGKRLLKLRVLDSQGLRLRFSQVVVRNLLRAVDAIPLAYVVGGIAMLLSRRRQRLGDLAAQTVVVRLRRQARPNVASVLSDKYNSLRDHPRLVARLRQRADPEAAGLALEALLRRDDLSDDARIEVFALLADYFTAQIDFPAEAREGLSDERYVRNVVDVLFGKSRMRSAA
jgi:uncharacterized RDD family membrane protein YckC